MRTVRLTPFESVQWNWAQDAASDFWKDDDGRDDGRHFDTCPVGLAKDGRAEILNDRDVIDDMIYRLGTLLPDIEGPAAQDYFAFGANVKGMKALSVIAAGKRIVAKLMMLNPAWEAGRDENG